MHTEGQIIAAAAKAARAKHEDDEAAARMMVAEAGRNAALRDAMLWSAARAALSLNKRAVRAAIWTPPAPAKPKLVPVSTGGGYIHRLKVRAAISRELLLMDFTLPTKGNKKLRDATGPEIVAGADHYETLSTDMHDKARWLRLVGASVPKGKTAGQALTEQQLKQMRGKAPKQRAA